MFRLVELVSVRFFRKKLWKKVESINGMRERMARAVHPPGLPIVFLTMPYAQQRAWKEQVRNKLPDEIRTIISVAKKLGIIDKSVNADDHIPVFI